MKPESQLSEKVELRYNIYVYETLYEYRNLPLILRCNPVGIWCQNDVVSTSMRRHHVASTLIRRHFHVMCLLGKLLNEILKKKKKKKKTYLCSCTLDMKTILRFIQCTDYQCNSEDTDHPVHPNSIINSFFSILLCTGLIHT